MTEPTVSVVVRCFNEEEHIGRLLSGLMGQQRSPDQIVIVDSGSTDATLAIASRYPVDVEHIDPEQFSFGRSLNIGCRAATGDVIVIASAHVWPVYDSWLTELTGPFNDSQTVLTYGRQLGNESTKYSEKRVMARWFPPASVLRQDHAFCNNANAAIRRSVWESQPYDEELTGLEDLDWAKKSLEKGCRIAYVATAPVVHAHDESWSQLVNRYRREAIAHKRIYHEQGMNAFDAARLTIANVASDYIHAARDGVILRNLTSIPAFRVAQFWGTYRGFNQRGDASAMLKRHFYYPHGWRRPREDAQLPDARPINYDALDPPDR